MRERSLAFGTVFLSAVWPHLPSQPETQSPARTSHTHAVHNNKQRARTIVSPSLYLSPTRRPRATWLSASSAHPAKTHRRPADTGARYLGQPTGLASEFHAPRDSLADGCHQQLRTSRARHGGAAGIVRANRFDSGLHTGRKKRLRVSAPSSFPGPLVTPLALLLFGIGSGSQGGSGPHLASVRPGSRRPDVVACLGRLCLVRAALCLSLYALACERA